MICKVPSNLSNYMILQSHVLLPLKCLVITMLRTVGGLSILLKLCVRSSWSMYALLLIESGFFFCWAHSPTFIGLWTMWWSVFSTYRLLFKLIPSLMSACNFFLQPHKLFHETVRSFSSDSGRFGWPFYRGNWRTWVKTLIWPRDIRKYLI